MSISAAAFSKTGIEVQIVRVEVVSQSRDSRDGLLVCEIAANNAGLEVQGWYSEDVASVRQAAAESTFTKPRRQ